MKSGIFSKLSSVTWVTLAVVGLGMTSVYGAPDILDESFDYGATDLVKPIGPWTGGASSLFIYDADGGMDDARLGNELGGAVRLTGDTAAYDASRSFTAFSLSALSEGSMVWVAFLFDYVSGTTKNHYLQISGGSVSGLGAQIAPDGTVSVYGSNNGSANGYSSTGLTVPGSGTYLMVIRGTKGAGSSPTASTIDFWLNPADTSSIANLGSPDWTTGADSKWGRDTESLSAASVGLSVGGRTDEIRVGQIFPEVMGGAPPPPAPGALIYMK